MLVDWLLVGVGLLLTVGTGVFVASEFALVNLDRAELEAREKAGVKGLETTINALRITSTHLSGAQLGITVTTLLTGWTFEPAVSRLLEGPLGSLGVPEGAATVVGSIVGVALATLFSMVVGELVPKNFALALPLPTGRLVLPFQTMVTALFKPLILLSNNTANALVRALGVEPKEELSGARSAEELTSLVRRSATQGLLDADQATLLDRTLRFADRDAEEVMTPRVRMARVRVGDSAAAVLALARRTGRSRFPVIGEDSDDVRGVVHVKYAFALPAEERSRVSAAELMVEPLRVPGSMGVERLLVQLREGGLQLAIVVDEWGGTAGLVTLEDLVEELVGELDDEHDRRRPPVTRDGDVLVFDAALRPDELARETGLRVPDDEDYETVGGFVVDRLDRLPRQGDEVSLDSGVLRVERTDGVRVERLRHVPHGSPAEHHDDAEEPHDDAAEPRAEVSA